MNVDSNDIERMITNHEQRLGPRSQMKGIFVYLREDLRRLVSDGVCPVCGNIRGSDECETACNVAIPEK
jgi:hypothetical protein